MEPSKRTASDSSSREAITGGAVGLRWNLFNGFGDKARIEESNLLQQRRSAEAARASSAIRLQVYRAYAALHAATQRIEVAQASVAEAEESLRITQNRYQRGSATSPICSGRRRRCWKRGPAN